MTYSTPGSKNKFYRSKEWLWLRDQALKRDNFECQQCKREGIVTVDSKKIEGKKKEVVLNVHHKYDIETYPKLALEIDNLETLCIHHHNKVHGKGFKPKKKKWNDERW